MTQLIDGPAMSESVDPQSSVATAHDLGFAWAVGGTFQGIGERGFCETIPIREHRPHRGHAEIGVIEDQLDIRQ